MLYFLGTALHNISRIMHTKFEVVPIVNSVQIVCLSNVDGAFFPASVFYNLVVNKIFRCDS